MDNLIADLKVKYDPNVNNFAPKMEKMLLNLSQSCLPANIIEKLS